jgi:hypothetical protein
MSSYELQCTDVVGGTFEIVLYLVNYTNIFHLNKYRYYKQYVIISLSTILDLYSEIALSRKPFGIGHMYTYTFFA